MGIEALLLSQVITISGTTGQVVTKQGDGSLALADAASGVGGTTGSVDNQLLRSDGTGGSTVQASGVTVSDSGAITSGPIIASGESKLAKLGVGAGTPDFSAIQLHLIGAEANLMAFYVQNTSATGGSGGSPRIAIGHGGPTAFSVPAWQERSFIEGQSTKGLALGTPVGDVYIYRTRATWNTGITLNNANRVLIGTSTDSNAKLTVAGAVSVGAFTFASVPSASTSTGHTIRISDRSHRLATSDGTNWNWAGTTTAIS